MWSATNYHTISPQNRHMAGGNLIQPKLKIGAPGDKYEQEANRVADKVMRMPDHHIQQQSIDEEEEMIQMQSAEEEEELQMQTMEEEEELQMKCVECEKEEKKLQMKPAVQMQGNGQNHTSPGIARQINISRDRGTSLPTDIQQDMSHKIGADFSDVNIHTDARAINMNQELGAKAFTQGRDIYFNHGQYNPESSEGKHLLAHELTHVIQQKGGDTGKNKITRRNKGNKIMCYRSGGPNFGACDSGTLKEKKYKQGEPWIEAIDIKFNKVKKEGADDSYPLGKLVAEYSENKLPDITSDISGGYASAGLSDAGNHKVTRIEGCGYHSSNSDPIPKKKRLKKNSNRYYEAKYASESSMSYAIFFSGLQAIHEGSLTYGSLACVHFPDTSKIQQLNYHSRKGKTKVKIEYEPKTLDKVCCDRAKHKGYMVSNPCGGVDKKKC